MVAYCREYSGYSFQWLKQLLPVSNDEAVIIQTIMEVVIGNHNPILSLGQVKDETAHMYFIIVSLSVTCFNHNTS